MKKALKWVGVTILALYAVIVIAGPIALINIVCDKHVSYSRVFAAEEFGLPEPDTLYLNTTDGFCIHTLKIAPEDSARGVVICISGIENPSVTAFYGHVKEFRKSGLVSYLPDVRGHGESDGDRICLAYEETEDINAVVRQAVSDYPDVPVILMGLSMGGGIAIRAGVNENVDAIVTLSAFSSFQDVVGGMLGHYITPVLAAPAKLSSALYAGIKFGVNPFRETPLEDTPRLAGKPVLMMHSRADTQVPYKCFVKLLRSITKSSCPEGASPVHTYVIEGDRHFIADKFLYPAGDTAYFSALSGFIGNLCVN